MCLCGISLGAKSVLGWEPPFLPQNDAKTCKKVKNGKKLNNTSWSGNGEGCIHWLVEIHNKHPSFSCGT